MTTVVANQHMMACDSMADEAGLQSRAMKVFQVDGDIIGIAGAIGQGLKFVEWYEFRLEDMPNIDEASILILRENGKLETWDSAGIAIPVVEKFYAIGSGAHAAMAAMHTGVTPIQAVKIACKVDSGSAPPVKVIKREEE